MHNTATSLDRPPPTKNLSKHSKNIKFSDTTPPVNREGHPASVMADNKQIANAVKHYSAHYQRIEPDALLDPHFNQDTYTVSNRERHTSMALVDRGANGFVAGEECTWIGGPAPPQTVHITGMDNHQL